MNDSLLFARSNVQDYIIHSVAEAKLIALIGYMAKNDSCKTAESMDLFLSCEMVIKVDD
jgi:hypothetical protein